ncbi:MAG: hypothetical protein ACREOO_04460 [bacterium]
MNRALETKYHNYKKWLRDRHLDNQTWVLNWDLRQNQVAEFGKGDALFFSGILLAALAIEKNEAEYIALLQALNRQKFAPGMYPRYPDKFNTSKDQYYPLILALVYGTLTFPEQPLVQETLRELVQAVKEKGYQLKNPDGTNTPHGDMSGFRPIFSLIEGRASLRYYLSLGILPGVSAAIYVADKSYYNNFMIGCQYLMYHLFVKNNFERWSLQRSVKGFAGINKNNPFFLMVRDLILRSREHQDQVEEILATFSEAHLPNDLDPIAHSDVLWQRDPRDWANANTDLVHEYAGIDYMILYQFYTKFYLTGEKLSFRGPMRTIP